MQVWGCSRARDISGRLSGPRPKRLLAPSLIDFRGNPGIRALYQAIGIPRLACMIVPYIQGSALQSGFLPKSDVSNTCIRKHRHNTHIIGDFDLPSILYCQILIGTLIAMQNPDFTEQFFLGILRFETVLKGRFWHSLQSVVHGEPWLRRPLRSRM